MWCNKETEKIINYINNNSDNLFSKKIYKYNVNECEIINNDIIENT